MPPGTKCPYCEEPRFHAQGSFRQCLTCGFVGWKVSDPAARGPGSGIRCPNCQKRTLHSLLRSSDPDVEMYRCTICLYAGVVSTAAV